MGRPKLATDSIATTERLLAAAEEEFAEKGFEAARLSDIAERVGIRRPSLLYHFESKHALYAAVVRTALLRLGEALVFEIEGRDPFVDRLARAVERFVGFVEQRPSLAKLLIREILDGRGPGHEMVVETGVPVLERVEKFLREEGKGVVPSHIPLRAALLAIVTNAMIRVSAGALRDPLWGPIDYSHELAMQLFGAGAHARSA